MRKICSSFIVLVCLTGCATTADREKQTAKEPEGIEDRWGIEIVGVRLTAAGHMLDFRYKVIDPEKASALLSRGTKAYLIDEASGVKLTVPRTRIGPMRQTAVRPQKDKTYFMFFGNLGDTVKPGNKVTVVIGEFRADHLVVEE